MWADHLRARGGTSAPDRAVLARQLLVHCPREAEAGVAAGTTGPAGGRPALGTRLRSTLRLTTGVVRGWSDARARPSVPAGPRPGALPASRSTVLARRVARVSTFFASSSSAPFLAVGVRTGRRRSPGPSRRAPAPRRVGGHLDLARLVSGSFHVDLIAAATPATVLFSALGPMRNRPPIRVTVVRSV